MSHHDHHDAPTTSSLVKATNLVFRLSLAAAALVTTFSTVACAPQTATVRRHHSLFAREAGQQEAPTSDGQWRSPFEDAVPHDGNEDVQLRLALAKAAASSIGDAPIVVGDVRYRFDCSGVAAGIYAKAGLPLSADGAPSTRALYQLVEENGSLRKSDPLPGDLVFFDNTWDQNGNGRVDDPLSHVGVVESVDIDGTVRFVHRIGKKIVRWRMNTRQPSVRADAQGRTLNHYLRAAEAGRPPKTTGELFVAFGSLTPSRLRRDHLRVASR